MELDENNGYVEPHNMNINGTNVEKDSEEDNKN